MPLVELRLKLEKYGTVQVLKDGLVFTLLLTRREGGRKMSEMWTPPKIMDIVSQVVGKDKPIVEVFKNDDDFLLLILKSKNGLSVGVKEAKETEETTSE